MKSLVTGGNGFIGSCLVEALIRHGHEVTCLVRQSSDLRWLKGVNTSFLHGDLDDESSYIGRLGEFDYIFHLAGRTKASDEAEYFHANSGCTKKFIKAASGSSRLRRFLHVSSLAAAGPSTDGRQLTEDTPPCPVSAYGRSKLEGENAVMEYRDRMPVTVIRPPAVYGPRDTDFFLLFRAADRGIFPYWGECSYSLIYVHDLIRGIMLAAENANASGKIYYISEDVIRTNDDIFRAISYAVGRKAVKLRLPRMILPAIGTLTKKIRKKGIINPDKIKEISYPHWICSPAKAMNMLGFRTSVSLEEGFAETAAWYRKERWL